MTNEELIKEARQHAEDAEAGYATGTKQEGGQP